VTYCVLQVQASYNTTYRCQYCVIQVQQGASIVLYRYRQGTIRHTGASPNLPTNSAASCESQDAEDLQDTEVQALLDWSTSLDFNVYSIDWNALGTSATSDAATGMK